MRISTPLQLLLFSVVLFSPCYCAQAPAHDSWSVPNCASFAEYQKNKNTYIRMPVVGFSLFLRPAKEVRSRKVNDVDYVLHIFSYGPHAQRSEMQGWFGPYASGRSVRDKSIQKSSSFTEAWAKIGEDKALDSQGETRDGKHWRYLDLGSSSLYYEEASREASVVFDSMLAKMCYEMWKL